MPSKTTTLVEKLYIEELNCTKYAVKYGDRYYTVIYFHTLHLSYPCENMAARALKCGPFEANILTRSLKMTTSKQTALNQLLRSQTFHTRKEKPYKSISKSKHFNVFVDSSSGSNTGRLHITPLGGCVNADFKKLSQGFTDVDALYSMFANEYCTRCRVTHFDVDKHRLTAHITNLSRDKTFKVSGTFHVNPHVSTTGRVLKPLHIDGKFTNY